jgi:hypothetical protein
MFEESWTLRSTTLAAAFAAAAALASPARANEPAQSPATGAIEEVALTAADLVELTDDELDAVAAGADDRPMESLSLGFLRWVPDDTALTSISRDGLTANGAPLDGILANGTERDGLLGNGTQLDVTELAVEEVVLAADDDDEARADPLAAVELSDVELDEVAAGTTYSIIHAWPQKYSGGNLGVAPPVDGTDFQGTSLDGADMCAFDVASLEVDGVALP